MSAPYAKGPLQGVMLLRRGDRFLWKGQRYEVVEAATDEQWPLVQRMHSTDEPLRWTLAMPRTVRTLVDPILAECESNPEWANRLVFFVDATTGERRSANITRAEALRRLRTYTPATIKRLDLVDVETDRFLSWAI